MSMFTNGIVIQKAEKRIYKGIDGDNWPFCNESPSFGIIYKEEFAKAWYSGDYVDVCNTIKDIKSYLSFLDEKGIEYRILLCKTEQSNPVWHYKVQGVFLGYDYAYSGGDYYSCVLNDLILGKFKCFESITINENGLFDSIKDLTKYVDCRNVQVENDDSLMFERGDFIIYELWELNKSILMEICD